MRIWECTEDYHRLWNAGDDDECAMLEALFLKAGLFWRCPGCGASNCEDEHQCGACDAAKEKHP